MLASILKEEYRQTKNQDIRKLYESQQISGCLFQSFSDFEKNIVLRFIANEGKIFEKKLIQELNQDDISVKKEFENIIVKLLQLKLIEYRKDEKCYRMFKGFIISLQKYILYPRLINGQDLPPRMKPQMEQFDLLKLLYEGNPVLRDCGLSRIDWRSPETQLTKANFDYIKAPISQKIGILIKGYLKYNKSKANLQDILILSLLDPHRAYKINQKNETVVRELQELKLLKRINQNQFVISEYLHQFTFANKEFNPSSPNKGSLKCTMIIETNFKVYTQIRSEDPGNYQMVKSILKSLVEIQHEEYNFQELIVGSITQAKMKQIFRKNISAREFFDFFEQYMPKSVKESQKDLGKWNRIKFLGLEGINTESAVPNNVKQEVKLWQSLQRHAENFQEQAVDMNSDNQAM